jgi:hypothetical protein
MPLDDGRKTGLPEDVDADPALKRSIAHAIEHHRSLGQALALLAVAALAFLLVPADRAVPTSPPVAAVRTIAGGAAN